MKKIIIFGTDKTFTVIFFSVLHDIEANCFGIFIEESSAYFLVHKQYAFVICKLKQIVKHPSYFICSCVFPCAEFFHHGSILNGCSLTNLHQSLRQLFYASKKLLAVLVFTYVIHNFLIF